MSRRALITVGEGYGNVVMATPTIAAAHALGYVVDALVESHHSDAATLLAGWDALDTIFTSRKTLLQTTPWRKYQAVIRTLWNRGKPLGMGDEYSPERLTLDHNHEADVNLTALRPLGYEGPLPKPHVEAARPFRPLPRRFITIGPGHGGKTPSEWRRKRWPHWQQFCERFHEESGLDMVILGGKADARRWMADKTRPWLHCLCGETSIRSAAGVIERSEGLVAVDGGLAHVGAALGRPVVALFGATSEIKNRPLGDRVRIVTVDLKCRPCQMTPRWEACADWRCMNEIAVEQVLSEVEQCQPTMAG